MAKERSTTEQPLTPDELRRLALEPQGIPQWRRDLSRVIIGGLLWLMRGFARHWLALLNIFNAVLVSIALLDPVLNANGWTDAGGWLYRLCGLICTQTHGHEIMIAGQPTALCQRCLATYAVMGLLGLIFLRVYRRLPRITFWMFAALCAPLVIDGLSQYFGWRESFAELRVVTGALFGLAVVWYMYPSFARGFGIIARRLDTQLAPDRAAT